MCSCWRRRWHEVGAPLPTLRSDDPPQLSPPADARCAVAESRALLRPSPESVMSVRAAQSIPLAVSRTDSAAGRTAARGLVNVRVGGGRGGTGPGVVAACGERRGWPPPGRLSEPKPCDD